MNGDTSVAYDSATYYGKTDNGGDWETSTSRQRELFMQYYTQNENGDWVIKDGTALDDKYPGSVTNSALGRAEYQAWLEAQQ